MACNVSNGRVLPCKRSVGGLKNIFFAPYSAVTAALVPSSGSITLDNSESFFKYEIKGNSSLETAINSSRENGTTFYETTLNATFTFLDVERWSYTKSESTRPVNCRLSVMYLPLWSSNLV